MGLRYIKEEAHTFCCHLESLFCPQFPSLVSLQRHALTDVQREERLREKSMQGAVMA
jgi:hypothetical protein